MGKIRVVEEPPLPREILNAVNENRLAVFVGAGVSRLLGCMGWEDLGKGLIEQCYILKSENGARLINFAEKRRLDSENDYKKVITICHKILLSSGHLKGFHKVFEKALSAQPEKESRKNYQDIYKIVRSIHALFLTTNVDGHFSKQFRDDHVVFRPDDIRAENLVRDKLYCLHGDYTKDKNDIVFTVRQYILRYNEPIFEEFLEQVFGGYVVLFIGYGMAEFEVLDYLITRVGFNGERSPQTHYLLEGYFSHQSNILEMEEGYYEELSVKVIPYSLNKHGYDQLYQVLKKWSEEINTISNYPEDVVTEIENIIDEV